MSESVKYAAKVTAWCYSKNSSKYTTIATSFKENMVPIIIALSKAHSGKTTVTPADIRSMLAAGAVASKCKLSEVQEVLDMIDTLREFGSELAIIGVFSIFFWV